MSSYFRPGRRGDQRSPDAGLVDRRRHRRRHLMALGAKAMAQAVSAGGGQSAMSWPSAPTSSRRARPGPVELRPDVLRVGRNFSTAQVSVLQDGPAPRSSGSGCWARWPTWPRPPSPSTGNSHHRRCHRLMVHPHLDGTRGTRGVDRHPPTPRHPDRPGDGRLRDGRTERRGGCAAGCGPLTTTSRMPRCALRARRLPAGLLRPGRHGVGPDDRVLGPRARGARAGLAADPLHDHQCRRWPAREGTAWWGQDGLGRVVAQSRQLAGVRMPSAPPA